jgi:hypothetical protein
MYISYFNTALWEPKTGTEEALKDKKIVVLGFQRYFFPSE